MKNPGAARVAVDPIAGHRVTPGGPVQGVGPVLSGLRGTFTHRMPVGHPVRETGGVEPVHIGYGSVGGTVRTRGDYVGPVTE